MTGTPKPVYDVAIIGAGLAGSAASIALAAQGWNVLLADKTSFPRHKVCGEFLSPESRQMFNSLGMEEVLEARSPALMDKTVMFLPDGKELSIRLPNAAWGISRFTLDEMMHQKAAQTGVSLNINTAVTSIQDVGGGWELELKSADSPSSSIIQARAVLGAWGRNPYGKLSPPAAATAQTAVYVGIKAHYTGVSPQNAVELYFVPGGYIGLAPVEDGKYNAAALLTLKSFQEYGNTVEQVLDFLRSSHIPLKKRLRSAQLLKETACAVSPVRLDLKLQAWDRFPKLGDAAVMIPPLCGDGMAIAIRSAFLCASVTNDYLKGNINRREWETRYERDLKNQVSKPVRAGRLLQHAMNRPLTAQMLFSLGAGWPWLGEQAVKWTRLQKM
ncbi:NAD(P)/FAD-dependent oxidoreductase [Paenibacillus gansuensis]|uniref:NAD(P)/FAD-dependent oxidoreductase n=1 Tax=Paenibacillus gansuensis TaxID=306542 RepID=A0ABW5PGF6_9BACL